MRTHGQTDDDLMRAAREGDQAAFTLLIRRHRSWVFSMLCAFTHDADQAEDLAQEVFYRVHSHIGDYVPRGQFVAWLKRIAVNLGRNAHTRKEKTELISLSACPEIMDEQSHADPMALLMDGMVRDEIRAAIQSLPDEQRLPVVMRYFGAMSVSEIAWAMKCPEGTIKSRIFYGLRHIRASLTPLDDPKGDPR